jgi:hypothetical protein
VTPLQEFKKKHGQAYAKLVSSEAFKEAMFLLNVEEMNKVITLSDEDIKSHGPELLADLRGHLRHENNLMNLHIKKEFKTDFEDEDEYLSPEQAAELEKLKQRFAQDKKKK